MVPWLFQDKEVKSLEDVPEKAVGMLYIITDINGYWYIGRKLFHSTVTRPPLKNTKRKRKVTKESNWLQYCSSNKYFKQLESWEIVSRIIIDYAYSKKELTFLETEALFSLQALRNPMSKNGNVLGKFYPSDITGNKKQ